MGKIEIEINENIYAAYAGLTASGYDLADKSDLELQNLITTIGSMNIKEGALRFFSRAKTDRYEVNPYWPRGSCITAACFFINNESEYLALDEYIVSQKLAGASREFESPIVIHWITQLPRFLTAIKNNPSYQAVWVSYRQLLSSRLKTYAAILLETDRRINAFSCGTENNARIVFVPNLLQAPQIADHVIKNNTIFVVTTHPDMTTLIHEYLHTAVHDHKYIFIDFINRAGFNKFADTHKMAANGYLWDESLDAKIRVLDESAVRGISVILAGVDRSAIQKYCDFQAAEGFLLVPTIIECSKVLLPTKNNLGVFLTYVLKHHISKFQL